MDGLLSFFSQIRTVNGTQKARKAQKGYAEE